MKSGFVAVAGRPNVGKSTLVNALTGEKVAIVSDVPHTTRRRIFGVANGDDYQLVLVDLPGFQRPIDTLTERMQRTVDTSFDDVDVVLFVLSARERIGAGDRFIARRVFALGVPVIIALNKVDRLKPGHIATQMKTAAALGDFHALHPVSAKTGDGVDELRDDLVQLLPEGPLYFPREAATDQTAEERIAELVREKALQLTRDEVPHAVTVEVDELEDKVLRAFVLVETESQKQILVGKRGSMIREIGTRARPEIEQLLGRKIFLELRRQGAPEVAARRRDARAARALARSELPCHDGWRKELPVDVLGRDDELRTLHAFLDGPVGGATTALVVEGEAGIGKSTLWRAGAEAARARGFRVLSSRPAELDRGIAYAAQSCRFLVGALSAAPGELAGAVEITAVEGDRGRADTCAAASAGHTAPRCRAHSLHSAERDPIAPRAAQPARDTSVLPRPHARPAPATVEAPIKQAVFGSTMPIARRWRTARHRPCVDPVMSRSVVCEDNERARPRRRYGRLQAALRTSPGGVRIENRTRRVASRPVASWRRRRKVISSTQRGDPHGCAGSSAPCSRRRVAPGAVGEFLENSLVG